MSGSVFSKCMKKVIHRTVTGSPFEAERTRSGRLAGLLTRASSRWDCLPGSLSSSGVCVPALRAHSGGAVPDFHRLPKQL